MTRLRTKGKILGVRLPLALDAVLRAEAVARNVSPGRYAGYVLTEALAVHQTGEAPVVACVSVDPGVFAALARVGVLTPVEEPEPTSLTGVVAPRNNDDVPNENTGSTSDETVVPTLKVAPGVPCSHPPSIRRADGVCSDCGWMVGPT